MMHGFETEYVRVLYYDLSRGYNDVYQSYNYFRFCTILTGRKTVAVGNGLEFTYNTNNYLLLPPETRVEMSIDTHTTAMVFELSDRLIEKVINKTKFLKEFDDQKNIEKGYYLGDTKSDISNDVLAISNVSESNEKKMVDDNNRFLIDLYAQHLVFNMMKDRISRNLLNGNYSHPISKAVRYINDNIGEAVNLETLASDLGMSKSNFTHTFKRLIGSTPTEYIKDRKMTRACEQLKKESVTEVAFDLGYSNISYFIRLFREKYHMTPKQYQMDILNEQMQAITR